MSIKLPDELLAKMWDEMDWSAAEEKLAKLQERLTIAVYRKTIRRSQTSRNASCVILKSNAWLFAML